MQPIEVIIHDPYLVSVAEHGLTLRMTDDELFGWVEDRGLTECTAVGRVIPPVQAIVSAVPHLRAVRVVTRGFLRPPRCPAGLLLWRWAEAAAAELQALAGAGPARAPHLPSGRVPNIGDPP